MPTRYFQVSSLDERVNIRGLAQRLRGDPDTLEVGFSYFPNEQGRPPYIRLMVVRVNDFDDRHAGYSYGTDLGTFFRGSENPPPSPAEYQSTLRNHLLEQTLNSTEGRSRLSQLGASMIAPIRRSMDYRGIARRALVVDPLTEGALPVYDRDVTVVRSPLVPQGMIYAVAEPENFGRFPVRTELTVLPADPVRQQPIGWTVRENLGVSAFNPRALERMGMSTATVVTSPGVWELPKWATPGTWIWNQFTDQYAKITVVESYTVWVENWRTHPAVSMINSLDINLWKPCEEPKMPRTWHERLDLDLV